MTQQYDKFLATKRTLTAPVGFEVDEADINPMLFLFQRAIVRWALHRGRAALFEDCGLGKTPQLGVIERAVKLWSAPGDLVLDPFNGIGSTGYVALQLRRRYVGIELKRSYYESSKQNQQRMVLV